jgi:hypothetical protein
MLLMEEPALFDIGALECCSGLFMSSRLIERENFYSTSYVRQRNFTVKVFHMEQRGKLFSTTVGISSEFQKGVRGNHTCI